MAIIAYIKDPTPALYGTPSISICTIINSSSESFNNFEFTLNIVPTSLHFCILNRFNVAPLVHGDDTGFSILLKFYSKAIMQFSKIVHLKFFREPRFEPLQLHHIACQYDEIIHVKNCHLQIFTCLFDV